jgi:beta-lactamase class A
MLDRMQRGHWWARLFLFLGLLASMPFVSPQPVQAAPAIAPAAEQSLTALGGTTALVVQQPGQAPLVSWHADLPMTSASLYKEGVMVAVYAALARGTLVPTQTVTITQQELDFYGDDPASAAGTVLTVAAALERMIAVSDNSAAGALVGLVGYLAVNAAFAAAGMPHSHMGTPPGTPTSVPARLAVTTAADQAAFYSRLLTGTVVSPAASEAMLELLEAQRENDRLPALLPAGTVMAHKTGELDDVQNDAGIIFTPRGPLICVALTNGQAHVDAAAHAIAAVGRLAYDGFLAAGPALPDYSIGDGWFYTEANGQGGAGGEGYSVTDAYDHRIWDAFQARGGVAVLGYPASHRFLWNGFVEQITQKEVLQWQPQGQDVSYLNIFDTLHDDGFDAWLDQTKQIPPPLNTGPDTGLPWAKVVARHQQLLAQAPAIRTRYFADRDALTDYGLPMAVKDYGPVIVVRCQRAAFQYWKVTMSFAPSGTVTLVNGGDIAKAAGIFPSASLIPGLANG